MEETMNLFLLIVIIVGAIILQIRFSRNENRFLGWILPALSFVLALLGAVGFLSFVDLGVTTEVSGVIETTQVGSTFSVLIGFFFFMLWLNIPTFIFIGIYFAERKRGKKKKDIEKMKIKDL